MATGNYSITPLDSANNVFTGSGSQVVLGFAGQDTLTSGATSNGLDAVLAGGLGNDTYVAVRGTASVILENGGSSFDVLDIRFNRLGSGVATITVDNRHLVIADFNSGTTIGIFDWKSPANRMESYFFDDGAVSYDFFANNLPSFRGNFAVQQTMPAGFGYLNPSTGLTLSTFNSFINDVSILAATPTPTPAPKLTTPIQRFQNTNLPGTYLFAGAGESASIRANFKNFVEEGFAFNVAAQKTDSFLQPLIRFQNGDIPGTYLFARETEAVSIRANNKNFREEGVAFYVYEVSSGIGTTYNRFQNTSRPGTYIFAEIDESISILANNKNFVLEGAAFNVIDRTGLGL